MPLTCLRIRIVNFTVLQLNLNKNKKFNQLMESKIFSLQETIILEKLKFQVPLYKETLICKFKSIPTNTTLNYLKCNSKALSFPHSMKFNKRATWRMSFLLLIFLVSIKLKVKHNKKLTHHLISVNLSHHCHHLRIWIQSIWSCVMVSRSNWSKKTKSEKTPFSVHQATWKLQRCIKLIWSSNQ